MAIERPPGPICRTNGSDTPDAGTLCRSAIPAPGPTCLAPRKAKAYAYAISGTVGALGSMLFTEATNRVPGTWYDRTRRTIQLVKAEAELGLSGYLNADARKAARRTFANIKSPPRVDVDIHFESSEGVEDISVRGRKGSCSFRFDFKEAEEQAKTLPKDADPFQPFFDTIDKILAAVIKLR